MNAIRAKAVINADGTVTFRVEPGTPATECEVILMPVEHRAEAAAARTKALAGAWADWDEFDDFMLEVARQRDAQE